MIYNFDHLIKREGTSCIKHDLNETIFGKKDIIPMWVADMDFETPTFVRNAVIERANHPIYGYTFRNEAYYESIINWFRNQHRWEIKKEWIIYAPGVVPALNLAVQSYTKPGDSIIVQSPVYFPFFTAVKDHERTLVYNTLIKGKEHYEIDFDLLEKQASQSKMLILCNPHNPVGRAWKKDELEKVAEICLRNNVLVVSDEIHNDLVLPGFKHHVFADLSPEIAAITITAHAASKTFNLAGLATSSIIISNPDLRKRFNDTLQHLHLNMGNLFGFVASQTAFNEGKEWLLQLLKYINHNVDFIVNFMEEKLPKIRVFRPEATYMIWLDFSAYGFSDQELKNKMIQEAGLGLNSGIDFGPGGEGCMRLNVACPRSILMDALEQMSIAFE